MVATAAVPPGGPLEIELVIDGLHAEARVADAPLGAAPLHPLATGPASMFLGSWVGVFATGAGHVDVDAIRLAQLL